MNKIRNFIEWHVFGVCTAIGERMGIATSVIRRYFIYISFLTFGSPIIFYLFVVPLAVAGPGAAALTWVDEIVTGLDLD